MLRELLNIRKDSAVKSDKIPKSPIVLALAVFLCVLLLVPSAVFAQDNLTKESINPGSLEVDSDNSQVAAFVTRFYQECLSRDPDSAGLNGWVDWLVTGAKTGADVAYGFVFSQEFQSKTLTNTQYLTILYKAFFNRSPDTQGLNNWLNHLNSGRSRLWVLAGFINSQEFKNLCAAYGITPGEIDVTQEESVVDPDLVLDQKHPNGWYWPVGTGETGGYCGWLSYNPWMGYYHLGQDFASEVGAPVYAIADGKVLDSSTSKTGYGRDGGPGGALVILHKTSTGKEFKALYGHVDEPLSLGTNVKEGQVVGYINDYNPPHLYFGIHPGWDLPSDGNPWRGMTKDENKTYGWVDPIEFLKINPGSLDSDADTTQVAAFVTRFYQECLSRDPDSAGLNTWVDWLESGAKTGADVAYGFVFSDEFIQKNVSNSKYVTILYRAFFGREPDSEGYNTWLSWLNNGRTRKWVLAGFINSQEFKNLCATHGINPGSIVY